MSHQKNRRDFLKTTAAVGAGAQALGQYDRLKMEAMNQGSQVGQGWRGHKRRHRVSDVD